MASFLCGFGQLFDHSIYRGHYNVCWTQIAAIYFYRMLLLSFLVILIPAAALQVEASNHVQIRLRDQKYDKIFIRMRTSYVFFSVCFLIIYPNYAHFRAQKNKYLDMYLD